MKVLDNLQVPVRGQETEKTQTELSELFWQKWEIQREASVGGSFT